MAIVPNRLLFRFEFPLRYRPSPALDGDTSKWTDEYRLPELCRVDAQQPFAQLWMAWNESGLYLACRVNGRETPLRCNTRQFWQGDNIRLMTDMRDTRDIKRGSRYCQQFYFLPVGGGRDGRAPVTGHAKVHRATENAPAIESDLVQVASVHGSGYYTVEGYVAAAALNGFDPNEHKRIGLYVMVEDQQFGQQFLTVGDEFNWYIDPSTWVTAVLTK